MYQRFEAETLKAALMKVKAELGEDAQYLTHRQVRKSGLPGVLGKKVWQVIAMKPAPSTPSPAAAPPPKPVPVIPTPAPARPPTPAPKMRKAWSVHPVDHVIDEPALPFEEFTKDPRDSSQDTSLPPPRRPLPQSSRPRISDSGSNLERAALRILVKEVRALAEKFNVTRPSAENVILPGVLPAVYQRLVTQEVPPQTAVDLMTRLCDRPTLDICDEDKTLEALEEILAGQIPTVGLDSLFSTRRPRILFVVGPSGVGKTSTLAKIGLQAARGENLKIAFVTVDTFRVAAAEQLKSYADFLPTNIEIVMSEEEFASAVVRNADKDLILVDTAGKNPCSPAALSDFTGYLKRLAAAKLPSPAVLTVLSASTKLSDLERYAACYRSLDPAALVLTKMDETSSFGSALPLLQTAKIPLVFLTCGQDIPEDIEPADALRLARKIVGR